MAALGSMAPVAVSVIRLAAICRAAGRELAEGRAMGASGCCGACAACAAIPPDNATAMTRASSRFVMLITISNASTSAYPCVTIATFHRTLRHQSPAGRRAASTGGHNQFTADYGGARSPIGRSAACRRSTDAWLPGVGAQHQRDRPVVDQLDGHLGAEGAGLDPEPAGAKPPDEALEQRPPLLWPRRVEETRPVLATRGGEQGELRHDQQGGLHLRGTEVELPGIVAEHAQLQDLVGEVVRVALLVGIRHAHQEAITPADRRLAILPSDRCPADALHHGPH